MRRSTLLTLGAGIVLLATLLVGLVVDFRRSDGGEEAESRDD